MTASKLSRLRGCAAWLVASSLVLSFAHSSRGADSSAPQTPEKLTRPATLLGPSVPYTPRRTEPGLELGLAMGREDLLQIGANFGRHLGTCMLVETSTCQQYGDLFVFWLLRDSVTNTLFLPSLRWHYINFPSRFSNYFRLMGGVGRFANAAETRTLPVFGLGWGLALYLHPQADLRLEARALAADRAYVTVNLGVQIKVDRLLDVFASKMQSLGRTTIESALKAGGETLRATGEGLDGVVEGVRKTLDQERGVKPAPDSEPK